MINTTEYLQLNSSEVERFQYELRIRELEIENLKLKEQVRELSINPNFNCNTRVAGLIEAEALIREERRQQSNSPLSLVVVDIGGMGVSNSKRGELATNIAMTHLLEEIRVSFRKGDIKLLSDGQLNSGDEFLFWISASLNDIPGILRRLDEMAKKHGFSGAYCDSVQLVERDLKREELLQLANGVMEEVYKKKEQAKLVKVIEDDNAKKNMSDLGGVGFYF